MLGMFKISGPSSRSGEVLIGVDEVGRGSLAGPLIVCAVVLGSEQVIKGVRDSKKVGKNRRIELVPIIDRESLFWVMAQSSSRQIDKFGINQCNRICMKWCAKIALQRYPDALVIVDGVDPVLGVKSSRQRVVIGADDKFMVVGAASIMAKVYRDRLMVELSTKWPNYLFHDHKGYGTPDHLRALRKYGPCPEHRISFKPVKEV